jgi:hypothetical protein
MNTKTNIYEVKINRKWSKVRATSMIALNKWCETMGIKEWRMCGMISITELQESKELIVVA